MMIRIGVVPQVSGLRRVLRLLSLFGLSTSLLAACQNNDCLKSAGDITTERRDLPAFEELVALDNVNITLVQDADTYAEVHTGANLQSDLKLEVRGSSLYVSNESTCNWARSYSVPHEVTLHVPRLTDIALNGQGNIIGQGQIRADTLYLHLKGAGDYDLDLRSQYLWIDQYELGDYRLRGQTDELLLSGGGLGRFFGAGLRTTASYVNLSPYADGAIHLNATSSLTGRHEGTSTIYYTGNPTSAEVQITGRGKLVKE